MKFEKYNKEGKTSFSLGTFATFELLNKRPQNAVCVLISSKLAETPHTKKLLALCKKLGVPVQTNDKALAKLSRKESHFVAGVFNKFGGTFCPNKNHLVLANPSDMGNLGTILRTALGFGFLDICIIKPATDAFNPKTIRASMGAIFSLNICHFNSIEDYLAASTNQKFFFMLDGTKTLGHFAPLQSNFDLIFGNESSGLPAICHKYGTSVVIEHSKQIDSLNLPISVGIALFEFSKHQ